MTFDFLLVIQKSGIIVPPPLLKHFTAILFLSVLLFNLAGYQVVIGFLEDRQDSRLVAQLDRHDYDTDELISIKTALSLPYYTNSETYERVDGTIKMDGIEYRYVQRRIFNDSLELLCLPNTVKAQLQAAKSDFFKLSNDWQSAPDGKQTSGIIKNVLPEFCEDILLYSFHPSRVLRQPYALLQSAFLPSRFTKAQDRPPEAHAMELV